MVPGWVVGGKTHLSMWVMVVKVGLSQKANLHGSVSTRHTFKENL